MASTRVAEGTIQNKEGTWGKALKTSKQWRELTEVLKKAGTMEPSNPGSETLVLWAVLVVGLSQSEGLSILFADSTQGRKMESSVSRFCRSLSIRLLSSLTPRKQWVFKWNFFWHCHLIWYYKKRASWEHQLILFCYSWVEMFSVGQGIEGEEMWDFLPLLAQLAFQLSLGMHDNPSLLSPG